MESERKFRSACRQIHILNNKVDDIQKRYRSAKEENKRSFRYNLRLKLAVLEGLRNMYYDYAHAKADQVASLRQEVYGTIEEMQNAHQHMETA